MGTHFSSGVTNVSANDPLAPLKTMDPTVYHAWFNDFDTYTAGDWTVTETQAGATQAITAGDGGLLALVNTAADNDVNQLQLVQETFRWASTKDFIMKARFKVSDATQSDLLIGLAITDTSMLETLPTDGIFFYKADGSTSLLSSIRKDGTSTSITTATVADDTYITVAFTYTAQTGEWRAWANGALVGVNSTSTNAPDDEDICISIGVQNGEAAAKTLTVDYLYVAKAR